MNEWTLMGAGDILLLHSDGLVEHGGPDARYFPDHLERTLRTVKQRSAREIYDAVVADVRAFAEPSDDVSLVVIKRR
jgi:serine phosphatase RsbU (regulator of sigma subunit)